MPGKLPASIGSKASPTGQELPLYTYDQLQLVTNSNLKARARDLKDVLKKVGDAVPKEVSDSLRTNAEPDVVIGWCVQLESSRLSPAHPSIHAHSRTCTHVGSSLSPARRILQVQVLLLGYLSSGGSSYTVYDFGLPQEASGESQFFTGNLPSIKKPKEAILAASPKKGPNMHDTPPKQFE